MDYKHIVVGFGMATLSFLLGKFDPMLFAFTMPVWLGWFVGWEMSNLEHRVPDMKTLKPRIYSKDLPLPPWKWDRECWGDLISYLIGWSVPGLLFVTGVL